MGMENNSATNIYTETHNKLAQNNNIIPNLLRTKYGDTEYIGIYELPSAAYWSNSQFIHVRFRAHIEATERNKKHCHLLQPYGCRYDCRRVPDSGPPNTTEH